MKNQINEEDYHQKNKYSLSHEFRELNIESYIELVNITIGNLNPFLSIKIIDILC